MCSGALSWCLALSYFPTVRQEPEPQWTGWELCQWTQSKGHVTQYRAGFERNKNGSLREQQ